ncbi:MAG: alpha/beta hydrolase family protein, partial [Actinomycetota bacterium]
RFPSVKEVFALGISMGGNASGMLVAHPRARRPDGKPLVDALVAVEGVHNLVQEYATFSQVSAEFREDVEQEAGGAPHEVPDRYLHLTNLARVEEMAYLRSAILVHGVDDLLVQANQSRDMSKQLRRVGVPTELYTVVGRGDGEAGTTITGLAVDSAASDTGYESPIAGHGWEGSSSHLVIRLGFEQLWKVMRGKRVGPYREVIVHGEGLRVPLP